VKAAVVQLVTFEHVNIVDAVPAAVIVIVTRRSAPVVVIFAARTGVAATRTRAEDIGNDVRCAVRRVVRRQIALVDHAALWWFDRWTEERRNGAGAVREIAVRYQTTVAQLTILVARAARRDRILDTLTSARRIATGAAARVLSSIMHACAWQMSAPIGGHSREQLQQFGIAVWVH